eukprot:gnl/TRDRNA2_/TRDRNA2_90039_c1_seq1.p1 gnl/TRDRNA2_/TRDRNA2_90039_c1~~gnl/TRDRNA2_/TRDRNA2_90039_c1_seq1.p1  ORF type:complete len:120 (+),score=14.11 gnl/TRDRNA2_/TRDRNA2_90039_c1_seq1:151-510(+)
MAEPNGVQNDGDEEDEILQRFVDKVGCENIKIRCSSTDVRYTLEDRIVPATFKECIKEKCLPDQTVSLASSPDAAERSEDPAIRIAGLSLAACAVGVVMAVALARGRCSEPAKRAEPLL